MKEYYLKYFEKPIQVSELKLVVGTMKANSLVHMFHTEGLIERHGQVWIWTPSGEERWLQYLSGKE